MAGTVRYSTVLKQVARVVSAAADDESYWPMRRAVQCEYRTVPYGGGVSLLLSYQGVEVVLVTRRYLVVSRIHSVIRIS